MSSIRQADTPSVPVARNSGTFCISAATRLRRARIRVIGRGRVLLGRLRCERHGGRALRDPTAAGVRNGASLTRRLRNQGDNPPRYEDDPSASFATARYCGTLIPDSDAGSCRGCRPRIRPRMPAQPRCRGGYEHRPESNPCSGGGWEEACAAGPPGRWSVRA